MLSGSVSVNTMVVSSGTAIPAIDPVSSNGPESRHVICGLLIGRSMCKNSRVRMF